MVTKLGPLCKVKLLKNNGDKTVVFSPEKAGVGGSTPSLATIFQRLYLCFSFLILPAVYRQLRSNPHWIEDTTGAMFSSSSRETSRVDFSFRLNSCSRNMPCASSLSSVIDLA